MNLFTEVYGKSRQLLATKCFDDRWSNIEAKIKDLHRMKATLVKLAVSCRGHGSISDCPILEALDHSHETPE